MELSKSDKKTARILMDKGILKEIEKCNNSVLEILTDWKNNKKETRETYADVYEKVRKNDKYIASNYDAISGSHYFDTVLAMFRKELLAEEDLEPFSEPIKQRLIAFKKSL